MTDEQKVTKTQKFQLTPQQQFTLWLSIGVGAGVSIGVAMHNIGAGIGIGAALGVTLGIIQMRRSQQQ